MEYFINPIWFYLIALSDSFKFLFLVVGIIGIVVIAIAYPAIGSDYDFPSEDDCFGKEWKRISKILKKFGVISFIILILGCVLPSRQTCKEMLVASVVTRENVSTVKEETYELIDYIVDKVNGKEEN